MSAARPIAIGFGPDPAEGAMARALAAALPGALRVRLHGPGWRRSRIERETDFAALRGWLLDQAPPPVARPRRTAQAPLVAPAALPRGAVLVVPGPGAWAETLPALLARRPDLRAIAVTDWPTARDWPEYHPPALVAAMRLASPALLRLAALVIVPDAVAAGCFDALPMAGGPRPLIVVESVPSPLAGTTRTGDPLLSGQPFVLAWGPIEARSNALMLLHLWRDGLARGAPLPKLVLSGERGAQFEEIAPLLDWNGALRAVVAEAPGLPAAALRRTLESARALVVPDFAGPPAPLMRDALAMGCPVIAADTPEARALALPCLDPLDGPAWRAAIGRAAGDPPPAGRPAPALPEWTTFAERLLDHAGGLP